MLELQVETMRLLHTTLGRHQEILVKMDESVERVSQHTVRIAQMLAEHTLILDRILQRLA